MEVELHIPVEQYGFVAVKVEADPSKAAEVYKEYQNAFKPLEGIPYAEFREFLDQQLLGVGNHADTFARLSTWQNEVVSEVRKSLARIKSRQAKQ